MITIARLRVRNLRALSDFDLRFPHRGRCLIDAAAGHGKSSILLGFRLALTGAPPGMAVGDIVRSGSDSARVELELSDGRDRLRLRRSFSASGQSASARAHKGLGEIRADGPEQVEALLAKFFAYPADQVADFFLWDSPARMREATLAADRNYLKNAVEKLTGDSDLERAIAAARGAVRRSHDSKRHRELVARRLRVLREWSGHALAVIAPALLAARAAGGAARAEVARLQRQLTEVEILGKLGGRSGQIYAATGQIIEQSKALEKACAQLRLLHDMATEPDGGESELIKLRARAGRLRSARDALTEALSLEARASGETPMGDSRTGAVLARLVDLRSGNAIPESARRAYVRWSELSEQIGSAAPAGVASRFALGSAGDRDPVRLQADLRILEREMTRRGLVVPDSPEQALQLAGGDADSAIAELEQMLRSPDPVEVAESGAELAGQTAGLRDRAATMLFGLDLPGELPVVEGSLAEAESEIANLEKMAGDPPALIAHTQEIESDVARIRALIAKSSEQLLELAPEAGFEDFELDLERVAALRKSVLEESHDQEAVEIAPNPVLERRLEHARSRVARLDREVAELEADAGEAAGILDKELESALVEAREREADETRKSLLEHELERLDGELGQLGDSLRATPDPESGPLSDLDIAKSELNLSRLQHRQRIRTRLSAALRGMDSTLADRIAARTLQNARNLLPQLSGGGYFDLQLAPNGSIQLWNESAGDWVGAAQCGSAVNEQTALLLWLARALTHADPDMAGMPGFLVLDDPGALTTERLRRLLADALAGNPLLDSIPQVVVLSERAAFAEAGFARLHSLGPN